MSDPFVLLGLPRRPWLDEGAIRTAFQERARRDHPDAEGGNAETFTALNAAHATLANPSARLRLLAGEAPFPGMPADVQLGFRVADVMRKVAGLRDAKGAASNVLVRALLAKEALPVRGELGELTVALEASSAALDARLRSLDERWPEVAAEELATLAGEYVFLARWQEQAREARLMLEIAFGRGSDGNDGALPFVA